LFAVVHYSKFALFELTSLGIPETLINAIGGGGSIGGGHGGQAIELPAEIVAERFKEANEISWRDIVLFFGGAFLIGKSVYEIHDEMGQDEHEVEASGHMFWNVIIQIALLDIVFSLDSVITAVGMVDEIWVMAAAIILAVIVMLIFAEPISQFVENNPTLKILALSFLILIGVMLIAESAGAHMDKGYIYFAMFFALIVEVINIRIRRKPDQKSEVAAS
jgi:predicted tellurium resistance membrane protein TerC